jgi:hypothetical protein
MISAMEAKKDLIRHPGILEMEQTHSTGHGNGDDLSRQGEQSRGHLVKQLGTGIAINGGTFTIIHQSKGNKNWDTAASINV